MKTVIALAFGFIMALVLIKNIQFDQDCGGYLSLAANANTVEIAGEQLDIALKYMEENKLTSGYTSILYKTPDEDVGYWYRNIKSARGELSTIAPNASQLEKTNVLMKLRETLAAGTPVGIALYPNNVFYGLLIFIVSMAFLGVLFILTLEI